MAPRTPEALLHDLWQHVLFQTKALRTCDGQPIRIVHPGIPNAEEGPDFLNAQLYLGETRWYGSVEVHVRSRDWNTHRHHQDARYNSVILHVVLEADAYTGRLQRADGTPLPELILTPYLAQPLRALIYAFYRRPAPMLPCAAHWANVPEALRTQWLQVLGIERLTARAHAIRDRLREVSPEQVLYERLLTTLGYTPNAEPMRLLAQRLPLAWLCTLPAQQDVEAALLGMAGLLPATLPQEAEARRYVGELRERFCALQARLPAEPLPAALWQRARLRPSNQPTLRLAQAAAWLGPEGWLRHEPLLYLRQALHSPHPLKTLRHLLHATPSPFWQRHVHFEASTPPTRHALGRDRIDGLLQNAVLPVLCALMGASEPLLGLLQQMPPENDRVVRRFAALNYQPPNAFFSQALHQLYQDWCARIRCLQCAIGRYAIGAEREDLPTP